MLPYRQLLINFSKHPPHFEQQEDKQSAVFFTPENFTKAKNWLGQELDLIYFDATKVFNLDAFAIAVGCLKAGGELHLWLNDEPHIDEDSCRWGGSENGIFTPRFDQRLHQLLAPFIGTTQKLVASQNIEKSEKIATPEQQSILQQIQSSKAEILVITAKRGRGKSALAGLLTNQIRNQNNGKIWLTAPNKSAVKNLQNFAEKELEFIAPDELCRQIIQNPQQFAEDWLFIDEGAMLPLATLNQLISTFQKIVITTTIHSYEGTGRGFLLKFLKNLPRPYQHFELYKPLRWREDDLLELLVENLLLLNAEDKLVQPEFKAQSTVQISEISQTKLVENISDFYGLLTLAHYRTSPLDLRRLLDAPQQRFWLAQDKKHLLGGVWTIQEGGLLDNNLILDICRGIRRPAGNLGAQSVAFYAHLPEACELTSLRISRIAAQPNWQGKGLGQKLISQLKADLLAQAKVDYISVSFGYTLELANFWQKSGFHLVQISEHKEASSGCYNAIMLCGLTEKGIELVQRAKQHFENNQKYSCEPLTERDLIILQNFANFHRTLASSIGAIRRLMAISDLTDCPLLVEYCTNPNPDKQSQGGKKSWLKQCRQEVAKMLAQRREYDECE